MVDSLTPTIEERVGQVLEILGTGNRCLGNSWALNFKNEKELHTLLASLEPEKLVALGKLLIYFKVNMESISSLLVDGERKSRTLPEMLAEMAWSNIAIAVMFSIVDKFTKGQITQRPSFVDFLKVRFATIEKPGDIETLAAEYDKRSPPSMRARLISFYSEFLTQEEIESVVRRYRSAERDKVKIEDFSDVIKDLYDRIRNGFLHAAGLEFLNTSPFILKTNLEDKSTEPLTITFHSNLTPSEILFLGWKAIFVSLGYKGEITTVRLEK